jgi:uncharacterized protein DUF6894
MGPPMKRYYFDRRDSEGLTVVMKKGLKLQDAQAAQDEAALSLPDAARDSLGRSDGPLHQMAIEVRTDAGPLMYASFSFDVVGRN